MTESICDAEATAFRKWRKQANLSTNEAAALLGKTTQMINILDNGRTYDGRLALPQLDTRMLKTDAARQIRLEPWPE
jgi:predicted transcriptional regulator